MATDDPPAEDDTRRTRALVNELARRFDAHIRSCLDGFDLTRTQGGALRELGEPLTMRELAARMCCEPPNASYVVDRLERSGWVERRPHPTDRRAKQLVLTPSGTELRERLMARLARGGPLAHLSGGERAALEEALLRAVCEERPQDTQEGQTPTSSKE